MRSSQRFDDSGFSNYQIKPHAQRHQELYFAGALSGTEKQQQTATSCSKWELRARDVSTQIRQKLSGRPQLFFDIDILGNSRQTPLVANGAL